MAEELFVFSPEVRAEMDVVTEAFADVVRKCIKDEPCGKGSGCWI